MAEQSLLRMEGITKTFPGVVANDGVSFELLRGEIHALVGENGAGKTTLMKILYGLHRPDAGTIFINGTPVSISEPRDAIRKGIGMVHQHFMLVPVFSVLENIVLGEESGRAGLLDWAGPRARVEKLMSENCLELETGARIEDIPVGLQQRVEILKILYRGAEILVFDEPTAVLTPQESGELFKTLVRLKEGGKGVIFISHKLDEVLAVADRITVIRRGRTVRSLDRSVATKPLIAELMVGRPVLLDIHLPARASAGKVLEVEELRLAASDGRRPLDGIGFSIQAGEIYGIAGVEGNGQTELVRALADRVAGLRGDIRLNGRRINQLNVRRRRELGIGHVPEDRWRYGLLLSFPVADNLVLGRHHRPPFVSRRGFIRSREIKRRAGELIREYDIRTPNEGVPASALSGGNQQKLIVARELSGGPALLLASQPTRGVDIGATEFIHRQLVEARSRGAAVLLVSADLDELLSLSDRIGVLFKGRIIREFERGRADKEAIGLCMTGEKSDASACL